MKAVMRFVWLRKGAYFLLAVLVTGVVSALLGWENGFSWADVATVAVIDLLIALWLVIWVLLAYLRLRAMLLKQERYEGELDVVLAKEFPHGLYPFAGLGEVILCREWLVVPGKIALRRDQIMGVRLVREYGRRYGKRFLWRVSCTGALRHSYLFTTRADYPRRQFDAWLENGWAERAE